MGEDAEVLGVFIEEDYNTFLALQIGGYEDGEAGGSWWGVEGEEDLFKTMVDETVTDYGTDCFWGDVSLVSFEFVCRYD